MSPTRAFAVLAAAATLATLAGAPPAASTPLDCTDTCRVAGRSTGFLPPVLFLASGAEVIWDTGDTAHLLEEQPLLDEIAICFQVSYGEFNDSDPVRFTVEAGGALVATENPGTAGETSAPCTTAVALPGGSLELTYLCVLHPVLMRGALVVSPA